jgi:hypothetical protein
MTDLSLLPKEQHSCWWNPLQLNPAATLLPLGEFQLITLNMKNAIFWDVTLCGSCQFLQEPHGVNIPENGILHSHP